MAKNFSASQLKKILDIHENTMMKIFNEKFERLEKQIDKLNEDNKILKTEVSELKKAVEFISEKYDKIIIEQEGLKADCAKPDRNLEKSLTINLRDKLAEIEDRSRRNNLRISGIEESVDESWDDCESKVRELIKKKLDLQGEFIIERAHRVGKNDKDNTIKKCRTIVVKFLNFKDKSTVLGKYIKTKLWNQRIYVNKDFSERTTELRKKLFTAAKDLRIKGFNIISLDRKNGKRGGGLIVYIREYLQYIIRPDMSNSDDNNEMKFEFWYVEVAYTEQDDQILKR
nr:uncharacterized protein LOC124812760 [Hydra vulgaris]